MKITKQAGTFNMYRLEASFGELDSIRQALEQDHSGAVADELYHTIDWYWRDNHMPFPGQEEEDLKKEKEEAKAAAEGEQEDGGEALGLEAPPEEPELGGGEPGLGEPEPEGFPEEGGGEGGELPELPAPPRE